MYGNHYDRASTSCGHPNMSHTKTNVSYDGSWRSHRGDITFHLRPYDPIQGLIMYITLCIVVKPLAMEFPHHMVLSPPMVAPFLKIHIVLFWVPRQYYRHLNPHPKSISFNLLLCSQVKHLSNKTWTIPEICRIRGRKRKVITTWIKLKGLGETQPFNLQMLEETPMPQMRINILTIHQRKEKLSNL